MRGQVCHKTQPSERMISVQDSISSFWLNLCPLWIPSCHKYYTNSSLMQGLVLTVSSCHGECVSLSCTRLSWFWILPIHLFCFFLIYRFLSHNYSVTMQCSWQLTSFCQISKVFSVLISSAAITSPLLPHIQVTDEFLSPLQNLNSALQETINYKPVCISSLLFVASPSQIPHFSFGELSMYFESTTSELGFSLF